jgi:hypothetical protein
MESAELDHRTVGEAWPGTRESVAQARPQLERRLPADPSQTENHAHFRERLRLRVQPGCAGRELFPRRLVARRRAPERGANPDVPERKPVSATPGLRLAREPRAMQRGVQEVPRPIAGEHPPGSVRPVCRWCQTDDPDPRLGIAETGHRTAPVRLLRERAAFLDRHTRAIRAQFRATAATGDGRVEPREGGVPHPRNARRRLHPSASTSSSFA